MYADINDGKYATKLEYPKHPKKPIRQRDETYADALEYANQLKAYENTLVEFAAAKKAYQDDNMRLLELFKQDALFETLGVLADAMPKTADKAYNLAWEHGHGSGLSDVLSHLYDYAEIIELASQEISSVM